MGSCPGGIRFGWDHVREFVVVILHAFFPWGNLSAISLAYHAENSTERSLLSDCNGLSEGLNEGKLKITRARPVS